LKRPRRMLSKDVSGRPRKRDGRRQRPRPVTRSGRSNRETARPRTAIVLREPFVLAKTATGRRGLSSRVRAMLGAATDHDVTLDLKTAPAPEATVQSGTSSLAAARDPAATLNLVRAANPRARLEPAGGGRAASRERLAA
ncbi:hypothetical protein LTR94_024205, partial [Friedmanniomyces endolithicus]